VNEEERMGIEKTSVCSKIAVILRNHFFLKKRDMLELEFWLKSLLWLVIGKWNDFSQASGVTLSL
jgi:hypothetical protein